MDDLRRRPAGFVLARTTEECLLLLRSGPVDILSLDYDMGPEDFSGAEVAKRIVLEALFPREIYLHTSSPQGLQEMYGILYHALPAGTLLHHGPLSFGRLQEIAAGAEQ
ncbi:cyclic-phosphate processing receiver domain-containing protein [Paenibacillus sp. MMS20-IR301]|uniref:cyclic-phosphate processing receiver domain-containing protein n=1 Tax=Paenibacillus sp. MMS20-IR301 TaxID=2895946 RepID=UPI0028E1C290|nr:cyclic-phosphate processing receiver domain-containing protein [Paenibacillus sp. MMS20-IR301]WNS44988.1 cell division protein FtsJ [Paenibacillus sp. MMS20-IR301]